MNAQTGAGQLFALVDCNNFYVSCERVFNPDLRGRPLVVLSNNDGCAVARSNEVKALGVPMGMPWFQMQDLARQHGIVALSSNYTLYGDMSNRVMAILRDFSPDVEVYSIDESFLSLNGLGGLWDSPSAMGQAMRKRVLQWTGLPVCVGIASSKTLAKLANHVGKKMPLFDGVCDFSTMSEARLEWLLIRIDVGQVWGVGRRISDRLRAMGINTVQALKEAAPKAMREQFGVVMERTCNELRGISCLALQEVAPAKQQIIASRSFGEMVVTIDGLGEAVSTFVARAAEKLRNQQSMCGAIHIFIGTNRFRERDRQYSNGITIPLPDQSCDNRVLVGSALLGLQKIFRDGYLYKKAGVILLDLSPASIVQRSLFDDGKATERSARAMAAMDALNHVYGRDTVQVGSAGMRPRWTTRAENKSARFTTNWNELPRVLAN
ncbi:MAG: Y-family DNA polymerase [Burkholderiaceae bacterium]